MRGCAGRPRSNSCARGVRNVMPRTVAAEVIAAHRQRLENVAPVMAKADLNFLETTWKQRVGQAVETAISMANRTQKETWAALGHNDGAQLNRWLAGTERPQFDALFAIDWLQQPLVIALAGLAGQGVEVTTHIQIRRSA